MQVFGGPKFITLRTKNIFGSDGIALLLNSLGVLEFSTILALLKILLSLRSKLLDSISIKAIRIIHQS